MSSDLATLSYILFLPSPFIPGIQPNVYLYPTPFRPVLKFGLYLIDADMLFY